MFEERGVEIAEEYDTPDWLPENAQREMEQAITASAMTASPASTPPTTAPREERSRL